MNISRNLWQASVNVEDFDKLGEAMIGTKNNEEGEQACAT